MRTPVLSIIFFLNWIIDALKAPKNVKVIPQILKYCDLMMSQLEFLQFFIEDLISLRMLQTGNFSLTYEPFDVVSVLKQICSIFRPQVNAKCL